MAKRIVAVDAMGGDNAPEAIVEGALMALSQNPELQIKLFGPEETLHKLIADESQYGARLEICDAREVIGMHEAPMLAVRRKSDSSMVRAMLAVKDGSAQAMVSAGSTGALLAGGILRIGRLDGIERPALTVIFPSPGKPFMLLDCGANVDCQPGYLLKFGVMGAVFMEKVMGRKNPDVRLVNIGVEKEKGNKLSKDAYEQMAAQNVFHFGGNIEARDVPAGACDVVVADGFDGNLILKYAEGFSASLMGMLKAEMTGSFRAKMGALLLKPALKSFKKKMSYEEYGGAPLLGVKGALVKAHGSANANTIKNAVRQAVSMIDGNVVSLIAEGVAQLEKQSSVQI